MSTPAHPARLWLPAALVLLATVLVFQQTAVDMVTIWIRSETFQHAFLVLPISAWLAWRQRHRLAGVRIRPVPWLLGPMALVALLWLMGDLATVAAATQLAMVSLMVLSVPALLGWELTRAMLFPLLFLFFAVPFGEFLVPQLQAWTADVTVFALRASGIPVYREGMQFLIPTGSWSVVEACSGFRYMVALFMVGTLYAYLNFESNRRRFLFAAFALLISLPANWIRAYSIVMIGHLTGSPMILGVEHTTYGWFLFGFVVMVLFWAGARWANEPLPPKPEGKLAAPRFDGSPQVAWVMVLAIVALMCGARFAGHQLSARDATAAPEVKLAPLAGEWRLAESAPGLRWTPGYVSPEQTGLYTFTNGATEVKVWIGYYRQQDDDRKLVTSMHRVALPQDGAWRTLSTGLRMAEGGLPAWATSVVSAGGGVSVRETERDRVWQSYWVAGRWSTSPAQVKLLQAFGRLVGKGADGAVVLLVTRQDEAADARLQSFAQAQTRAIEESLAAMQRSR